jgi:tripartite-type tricarboxylate transporter receptor subunit TctC
MEKEKTTMKKKIVKLTALLTAAMMLLTACGASGDSSTTTEEINETVTPQVETPSVDFPTKSIDIVVPFAAGGNVDLSCRILAQQLEEILGQTVNVINKEGSGAILGQTYALSQPADGYTILALTSSFVTNVLGGSATYGIDDVIPIGEYCFDPELIVASADSGIETLEDFIALGQERSLLNTTPGFSTSHHIASILFARDFGVEFDYMHTDGSSEQTVQLAGGHAEVGFTTYAGAASLIQEGKIKVLAVCADERSENVPDVPTVEEVTGQRFVYGAYRGLGVPAGTPDEVVAILESALAETLASDEVIEQFANSGLPISYLNAADFQALLTKDYEDMSQIQDLIQAG